MVGFHIPTVFVQLKRHLVLFLEILFLSYRSTHATEKTSRRTASKFLPMFAFQKLVILCLPPVPHVQQVLYDV